MNPAARRNRRRRLAWTFPLLLVGGGLWFLQSETAARFAKKLIEEAVEVAIGEDVTIGQLHIRYWPLSITLEGVVISHPETGETAVVVRSVMLTGALQSWKPVLRELRVDDPVVVLHLENGKLREFQRVKSGEGPPAEHLPWQELVLNNGTFRLITPTATLEIDRIRAAPDGERMDLVVGRLALLANNQTQSARDIVLEDVLITPQVIEVPDFDFSFGPFDLEGSFAKDASNELSGLLSVQSDMGRVFSAVERNAPISGLLALDLEIDGNLGEPKIAGSLMVNDLARVPAAQGSFGDIQAQARLNLPPDQHPSLILESLSWPWAGGDVAAEGQVDLVDKTVTVTARGEALDLGRVLASIGVSPTPWVSFQGDAEVTLSGSLSPLQLKGPFELALIDLLVASGPVAQRSSTHMLEIPKIWVTGQVSLVPEHLVFEGQQVVSGKSHGSIRADVGIMGSQKLAIEADFPVFDLGLLNPLGGAGLAGVGSVDGELWGSYGKLQARMNLKNIKNARLLDFAVADTLNTTLISPDLKQLQFPDLRASLRESLWQGRVGVQFLPVGMYLDVDLEVPKGRVQDFSDIFVDLGDLEGDISGKMNLQGGVYDLTGAGSFRFRYINLYGEKFPVGTARVFMDDGRFTLEELLLVRRDEAEAESSLAGDETLLIQGSIGKAWALNMGVLWDGASLPALDHLEGLSAPLKGQLGLWASVGGTLFEPEPSGSLMLSGLTWDERALEDSRVDFSTTDGVMSYAGSLLGSAIDLDGSLGLWDEQPYQLAATLTHFPLDTFYPVAADGEDIDAYVSGKMTLSGEFGDTPTPVSLEADVENVFLAWGGHELSNGDQPWHIRSTGRDMEEISLHIEDQAHKKQEASAADSADAGTFFDISGSAHPGRVELKGTGQVELDLVRAVVPGVIEAQGNADVIFQLYSLKGQDADIEVTVDLDDALLMTEYFPLPFESISGTITATPDQWVISNLSSEVGGGTLKSRSSTIYTEDWWPDRYALAGTVRGVRVQYLDYLPPMLVDGELAFDGPTDELLLSGELRILDMQFRERVDWEGMVLSLQDDYLTETAPEVGESWFGMDLSLQADKSIHLRNNVANAEASADLRMVGDTARPGMIGDIRVEPGGLLYLQEREFEVSRGEIHYIEPYSFDPDLDLELITEISSQDEDYRIRYLVSGPFSNWTTSASSEPALSQADINALLLFGVTREEMERGGYGSLGTALAVETGGLLSASITSNSASVLIDRLLNRWTLVTGVTERGSKTVSNAPRIVAESSEIAGFTFTGEFSFTGDWYISVERRIASRLYAATYATNDQTGRAMPVAAFGAEFKLRWEMD